MESNGKVEALLHLQEIDREIEERRRQLLQLEAEIESGVEELATLERRVEEARGRAEESDAQVRKYQRSVQAGRATLRRLETRANEIQNMRQHVAVRAETEAARRNLRNFEEDAMDALRDAERYRKELEELESELTERREAYRERRREYEERRSELEDEIAVRRDRKKNRETRLEGDVLRLYEKVRSGRTDRVLAPLTVDGVCGHCFTAVPLQRQADIRSGRDLSVCEGCGVILYVAE